MGYYDTLRTDATDKLSAKAFLATGQRIPGVDKGVFQDFQFCVGIHPKAKLELLPPWIGNTYFTPSRTYWQK